MAEKILTLDTALDTLTDLSESAETEWNRFIITHTGKPQSVLLSYQEYRGMIETIALLQQPKMVAQLNEALGDIARGERVPWISTARMSHDSVGTTLKGGAKGFELQDSEPCSDKLSSSSF